jgi:hypothetical protein
MAPSVGDEVELGINGADLHIFELDSGEAIDGHAT